jgi:UDP-glucose 4-epimerase
MKPVLITGNKGYIGQHLVKMIEQTRPDILVHGCDIQETSQFNNIDIRNSFTVKYSFHTIIHLAALVRVGESVNKPSAYYDTNVNGTRNLLNTINHHNFIFASTGAAENPTSPYGFSKRIAEDIVKERAYDYTIFRFYNVIGTDGFPPTNPDGLMMNLMKAKETGKFTIHGNDYPTKDGTCVREYVHVNDICRAIIKAIDNPSNRIENLAYGDPRTTKEIVETFTKVNDIDCSVEFGPRREGDLAESYLKDPSPYMERHHTYEEMLKV